jgi:hypothetical protein
MSNQIKIPAGYALTVTPSAGFPTNVYMVEDSTVSAMLYGARTFGPYLFDATFVVTGGGVTTSTALAGLARDLAGLLLTSDGAPVDAVRATVNVNPTGDDNSLTITARAYGASGNEIRVTYLDPAAASQSLAVSVAGPSIVVSLATNGGSTITSTAAQIKAAIEAHEPANRLVSVAIHTGDSGVADDGSGVVTAMASTALTGGAGSHIGIAKPGGICIDTTNGALYRNSGTQAAPAWTQLGDAA